MERVRRDQFPEPVSSSPDTFTVSQTEKVPRRPSFFPLPGFFFFCNTLTGLEATRVRKADLPDPQPGQRLMIPLSGHAEHALFPFSPLRPQFSRDDVPLS